MTAQEFLDAPDDEQDLPNDPSAGTPGLLTARTTTYFPGERYSDPDTDAGRTATGGPLVPFRPGMAGTVAVDPAKYPYGTIFKRPDGSVYVAADTGGAVKSMKASGGRADVLDFASSTPIPDWQTVQVIPPTADYTRLSPAEKVAYHQSAASLGNFGSARAFLDAPDTSTVADDGLDGGGGGASQGNVVASSVPGYPDTFLTSNDGGALNRAQASLQGNAVQPAVPGAAPADRNNGALIRAMGGVRQDKAAPAAPPLGSAAAFLAAPDDAPTAKGSNVPGNPFAVPTATSGNGADLQPVGSVPPTARNVTPGANVPGNPFTVPTLPQNTMADTFTPSGQAFLDKLVAPNPALTPPDTSVGHQAANAGREVLGGAASGVLSIAEGGERLRAGTNAATPTSVASYLDQQIAANEADLQRTQDMVQDHPASLGLASERDRITSQLASLRNQRADLARVQPGDVPGVGTPDLLTVQGQVLRDKARTEDNAAADADKMAREQDVPTMFGQDPALKDTPLARVGRAAGGAVPLVGASMLPGAGVGMVAGAGVAALQAKGSAYDDYYADAIKRGVGEDQAQQEAQQYSDAAALRTVPEMVTYLGTGKIAASVVSRLLSPSTPTAVRMVATAAASTLANAGAGTVNQLAEQAVNGKPLDPSYDVERGVQDALFGGLHTVGEMGSGDTAPGAADAVRQDADAARPSPVGGKSTPDTTPSPAPDADTAATPPTYATGDTPEQRAESFLSSSDDAPVTAARFEQGEEVPASLGRFPQAKPDDGSTVVYDPGVHDADDFTAPPSDDQDSDPTSTANAVTEAERIRRGFAPAEASARRDFGQVWDDAKGTLADDPGAGQRLVDALKASPRPVSDTENALLLHQQIAAQAEHDAAVQAMNNAPDDAARASAQVRLARASDALTDVYNATNAAGAATGRGLNARKMLANQDYSLGDMLAKRQAAEGGKSLTADQQAEVRTAHEKVADTRASMDAHRAMVDDVDRAMNGGDPDWSGGNEDAAEARHRADLKQQAREGIDGAGGVELLDAVREAGGLPTDDPDYRGELQTIREAHAPVAQAGRTGTFNLHRNNAPKLDELTSRLRARGFDVETPDDALNLIYGRLTDKKPVYGFAARADAQSGMAGSDAYFRRQRTAPPRTPEELRPVQEKWTRMLRALSPQTALRLEVVKQSALDSMWQGQKRPTAEDGSSPHAAYLDGAVYLSHEALKANSDQINRVNTLHELTHHFERALPAAERIRLEGQWKQEMASGDSPLHDTDGTPRADVDQRAFDTSDPKNFSEWLAERVAWNNEQHYAGKMDTALNGTPSARLAARIRDFVGRVWKALKPGMAPDDLNSRFRDWLGNGARVDSQGTDARAAIRPRTDYVQAVRDFFGGRLPANAVLDMGRPGEILRRAGLENLPIRLSQRVLRRKTGKHPEITQDVIERLPDLINKPTMVYDTPGDPTGKGVITSEQTPGGKTLTVFANLKIDGDRAVVYNVKSLYGKIPDELLRELHQSPRIGYADPEKAPAWVRQSASQTREPFQHLPTLLDRVDRATQGGGSQDNDPQFAQRRTLTDDERLDRAKKSLARRRDELLRRVAVGDLTPKSRARVQLDAEGQRLQAEHARAKQAFDEAVERARQASLPRSVRFMKGLSGVARASAISGYHTLGKLFSFSVGAAGERPLTELTSAVIEHTPGMRRIAAKADMESGSHVASLARFYSQMAGRGMAEAARVLRTGKSTDSALYGKPRPGEVPHWYDFIGRIHDAEKTPLFTGAMEAYRTKAYEHAIRQGLDPHDPMVRGLINQKSYEYALADKLQENNSFADAINKWHRGQEAPNPATGRVSTEKVLLNTLIKTIVTKGIVKTPANYVKQALFERSPIGLVRAFAKAGAAHVRGVDALTDQEANHITRLMKLGMVGTAMTLWGMYDATKDEKDRIFGGYYQPGDKRGDNDVDFGRIRIAGHQLPHWASHAMILEPAQFGSTIMRVARSQIKKTGQQKGYAEGVFQAALAPINNAPVVSSVSRIQRDSKQGGAAQVAGNLVQGLVPQLVQNIAEDSDKHTSDGDTVPRRPVSIADAVKMGIPGLREQVPVSPYRGTSEAKRQKIEEAMRQ